MKKLLILFLILSFQSDFLAQDSTWNSKWSVEYVTSDSQDSLNSIGINTIAVTVISENSFVALTNSNSNNAHYLVGFRDAGVNTGKLGIYDYSPVDKQTKWYDGGFSQEFLNDANDLASSGNLIYVPNNDETNHSILIFELQEDSVYSVPQRYKVESYIWAIDVDANGRIYVTKTGDSLNAGSVLILENPNVSPVWAATGVPGTILQEFNLPDIGSPRGLTVNDEGTLLYVSNWDENKIYSYIGDPVNGYTLHEGFSFDVPSQFEAEGGTLEVGPFGLQYMEDKNLLFVTHDASFVRGGTTGYTYGRIYMVDPNDGTVLDTLNTAEWNNFIEGQYDNHNPQNKASGYTSTYCVDYDENYNIYTQSYYGWTVDKWIYDGELPIVEVTITSVEKVNDKIPNNISLSQNYPNPFNPTTTIKFSINKQTQVTLAIYSVTGELVTHLIKPKEFNTGSYEVTFEANNLASGTYIYKLDVGDYTVSKKMTLLK
jgi:hypothetical protein